jgi:hypothetical protein
LDELLGILAGHPQELNPDRFGHAQPLSSWMDNEPDTLGRSEREDLLQPACV